MLTAQLPILSAHVRPATPGASKASARTGADGQACDVGALLLRVADREVQAFDELYACTSRRVYGLVRKVLVDAEMSAETTQDVFLALWLGGAARFDPAVGSGMSWIMTLAHRRAVDKVRVEESHRARDLRWGIKNHDVDYDQVADTVVQRAEMDAVRASLSVLSGVQREAIDLAYYAGMTYVQVADHLGVPVPTAKTRIRDGIARLRACLQDPAPDPLPPAPR
ncbi:ECF RNA polymerase sigma factor SigK [Arthrobacter sp. NPDC092385]|uniref:ECF RNA polymerase sigma factor SigK n=1 Tax=Arthrobacter sp. NPDC092385 TaxID=3363943 RepID=UPI00381B044B